MAAAATAWLHLKTLCRRLLPRLRCHGRAGHGQPQLPTQCKLKTKQTVMRPVPAGRREQGLHCTQQVSQPVSQPASQPAPVPEQPTYSGADADRSLKTSCTVTESPTAAMHSSTNNDACRDGSLLLDDRRWSDSSAQRHDIERIHIAHRYTTVDQRRPPPSSQNGEHDTPAHVTACRHCGERTWWSCDGKRRRWRHHAGLDRRRGRCGGCGSGADTWLQQTQVLAR